MVEEARARAARGAAETTWSRDALLGGSLLAPFVVALALRLALVASVPVLPAWDGEIYVRGAEGIAQGIGYTRASMGGGPEPTAFYPVGFSALLAAVRWLRGGLGLDLVVQALAGALAVLGAASLAHRAGGRRTAALAAGLVALWPGGILLAASWLGELVFADLVVLASAIVAGAPEGRALAATAASSAVLGVAAYVRPTAIPMALALAGFAALAGGGSARARLRAAAVHTAVALGVVALVLLPWTIRNALVLGAPVPVSTNGGVNLFLGTLGVGDYRPTPLDTGCDGLSEIARDRCFTRLALDRIAAGPSAWLARGVLKLAHTFGHESSPAQAWRDAIDHAGAGGEARALWALALTRAFYVPFLAASIAGAVILLRGAGPARAKAAIFAPIVALGALHFVVLGGDRYHVPVVPHMAVLASVALLRAFAKGAPGRLTVPRARRSRRRAVARASLR